MVAVPSIFTSRLSCPVTEAAESSVRMSGNFPLSMGVNDLMCANHSKMLLRHILLYTLRLGLRFI